MSRNFRLPGPVELHSEVYERLSEPMMNHRGSEFAELLERVTTSLKAVFQTEDDVLMLNCGGTGAIEAAVANLFCGESKILVLSNGFFGDCLKSLVASYCTVVPEPNSRITDVPWGDPITPEFVEVVLRAHPDVDGVYLVHNETSTGVTNPIEEIGAVIQAFGEERGDPILFLVDAVSSLGGIELCPDDWGIDVVVTGSQKALGAPPGLSFVSLSPRAWVAHDRSDLPAYYWDFSRLKSALEIGQPFTTPALPTLYGLDRSLELMLSEGLENVFARHTAVARAVRQEVQGAGFELLVSKECARSDTVTAVKVPKGTDGGVFLDHLKREYGVELAGCPGKLNGKVFRIGHMGCVSEHDVNGIGYALTCTLWDIEDEQE